MEMGFAFTDEGGFLRFRCTGDFSLAGIQNLIEGMRAASEGPLNRILIDMTGLTGDFHNLLRFQAGELVAERLKGRRILVITQKERINRLAENTAINRGAQMFVTHDEAEGLEWLLSSRDA